MPLRTRIRTGTVSGQKTGAWPCNVALPLTVTTVERYDKCIDTVLTGDGHSLDIHHGERSGGLVNGMYSTAGGWVQFDNVPMSYSGDNIPHVAISSPTDGAYATKLLAMTNPSRPVVDIPVFIAELKDVPRLIKLTGDNIIRKAAGANLNAQFGWRPLLSDLRKMLNFHDHAEKRRRELEHLAKYGLKRTRTLDNLSGTWSAGQYWSTVNCVTLTAQSSRRTELTVKGHVKWFPTSMPPAGSFAMRTLAMRAVLGLELSGAAAWELIPFSWLLDYFGNTGTFLNAHRNLVPATHSIPEIMRETTTWIESVPSAVQLASYGLSASPMVGKTHTLSRKRASATLSAHLPWLNGRQWSILASLFVLKHRRLGIEFYPV